MAIWKSKADREKDEIAKKICKEFTKDLPISQTEKIKLKRNV